MKKKREEFDKLAKKLLKKSPDNMDVLREQLFFLDDGGDLDAVGKLEWCPEVAAGGTQDGTELGLILELDDSGVFEELHANVLEVPKVHRVVDMLERIHVTPDHILTDD